MSTTSLVIACSVIWLTWRVIQLWSTPLTVILRHLQIELPSAPRITIDSLSADCVSLHWAPSNTHVRKHIIQMDGQEVGISVRGETSVTISGLTPDYLYSIQVIAVNAQGFQVPSPVIFVRTRPKTARDELDNLDENQEPHMQTHPQAEQVVPITRPAKSKVNVETSRTKDVPVTTSPAISAATSPSTASKAPASDGQKVHESRELIADLTLKMEGIRKETSDIDAQITQLNESHALEESNYQKKIDELRMRKKEEDDARTAKDQHHKQLDQQRREIESKRNQVQKALKAAEEEHRKRNADILSFKDSTKNSLETVEHLEEAMKTLETEANDAIRDAERTAVIASEELGEIESEIRYLLSRKVEAEAELARLQSESRAPSPSPQEIADELAADQSWREREESLARQYEEAQANLLRLHSAPTFSSQNPVSVCTPVSDVGESSAPMRRATSRRGKNEEMGRAESTGRSYPVPTFNPDAAPFVASSPLYVHNEVAQQGNYQAPFQTQHVPYAQHHNETSAYVANRANVFNNSPVGTTSIFSNDPGHVRVPSPFIRRESPLSSQSGSNPPSPALQNRSALPSIFNTAPQIQSRNSAGSLVDRLNGTPIDDASEKSGSSDPSKWSWSGKKRNIADPLALDRKNTRSLPKVDVAPIGTRRNRSGSLREDNNQARTSNPPQPNVYHDVDLLNIISQPLERQKSAEHDYSTSAFPLPRPSSGSAFGWEPQIPSSQRNLPNPWNSLDNNNHTNASVRGFDPFGDMPVAANPSAQLSSVPTDFLSVPPAEGYHTTIDASRLPSLNRISSSGSRRSSKSKAESQESKERNSARRLGEAGKFSSFVGRVFGKKEERDRADDLVAVELPETHVPEHAVTSHS